jgi:hypothetical protein
MPRPRLEPSISKMQVWRDSPNLTYPFKDNQTVKGGWVITLSIYGSTALVDLDLFSVS